MLMGLDKIDESLVSLALPYLEFRLICLLSLRLLVFEVYLAQEVVQLCRFELSLWLLLACLLLFLLSIHASSQIWCYITICIYARKRW